MLTNCLEMQKKCMLCKKSLNHKNEQVSWDKCIYIVVCFLLLHHKQDKELMNLKVQQFIYTEKEDALHCFPRRRM